MTPTIDASQLVAPRLLPLLRQPQPASPRPSQPETGLPEIEQGVIEEARRRQRRRRIGIVLAVTVAAAVGAALAGMVPAHGAGPGNHGPGGTAAPVTSRHTVSSRGLRKGSDSGALRIFPALDAGDVGWRHQSGGIWSGGGGCCALLTRETQIMEGTKDPGSHGWWTATVLAAPFVTSVSVEGRKPVATHSGRLPFGLRFATIRVRRLNAKPLALDAQGRPIDRPGSQAQPTGQHAYAPLHWSFPAAPPSTPCEIAAAGLPGLSTLEGSAVGRVRSFRSPESPALQSCADTVYRLDGHTFQSAILLDAEHPGRRPAPLPGMTSVAGRPGLFQAPGGNGIPPTGELGELHLAARRVSGAWVVVASTSSASSRLALLSHLHASIHLGRHPR